MMSKAGNKASIASATIDISAAIMATNSNWDLCTFFGTRQKYAICHLS